MDYNKDIRSLFARLINHENKLKDAKKQKTEVMNELNAIIKEYEGKIEELKSNIDKLMSAHGVVTDIIEGQTTNYKISYTSPRTKVVCSDVEAIPDEYCRIKKEPDLNPIKERIKLLEQMGKPLPNWVTVETGESSITWRSVKK